MASVDPVPNCSTTISSQASRPTPHDCENISSLSTPHSGDMSPVSTKVESATVEGPNRLFQIQSNAADEVAASPESAVIIPQSPNLTTASTANAAIELPMDITPSDSGDTIMPEFQALLPNVDVKPHALKAARPSPTFAPSSQAKRPRHKPGERKELLMQAVKDVLNYGISMRKAAQRYNLAKSSLCDFVRKNHIKLPNNRCKTNAPSVATASTVMSSPLGKSEIGHDPNQGGDSSFHGVTSDGAAESMLARNNGNSSPQRLNFGHIKLSVSQARSLMMNGAQLPPQCLSAIANSLSAPLIAGDLSMDARIRSSGSLSPPHSGPRLVPAAQTTHSSQQQMSSNLNAPVYCRMESPWHNVSGLPTQVPMSNWGLWPCSDDSGKPNPTLTGGHPTTGTYSKVSPPSQCQKSAHASPKPNNNATEETTESVSSSIPVTSSVACGADSSSDIHDEINNFPVADPYISLSDLQASSEATISSVSACCSPLDSSNLLFLPKSCPNLNFTSLPTGLQFTTPSASSSNAAFPRAPPAPSITTEAVLTSSSSSARNTPLSFLPPTSLSDPSTLASIAATMSATMGPNAPRLGLPVDPFVPNPNISLHPSFAAFLSAGSSSSASIANRIALARSFLQNAGSTGQLPLSLISSAAAAAITASSAPSSPAVAGEALPTAVAAATDPFQSLFLPSLIGSNEAGLMPGDRTDCPVLQNLSSQLPAIFCPSRISKAATTTLASDAQLGQRMLTSVFQNKSSDYINFQQEQLSQLPHSQISSMRPNEHASLQQMAHAKELINFVNKSPSPFHVVRSVCEMLSNHGFREIREDQPWKLKPNDCVYLTKNNSSVFAISVGGAYKPGNGFSILGAHTDSPCLRLKPCSERVKDGFVQLAVETYGGGLWYTWFDRDLTLAGRCLVRTPNGGLEQRLVHVNRPIACVPSLAIHLNREANTCFAPNPEQHLPPILCTVLTEQLQNLPTSDLVTDKPVDAGSCSTTGNRHPVALLRLLAEEMQCFESDIVELELYFADTQPASLGGVFSEFVHAPRLDNQFNAFTGIQGLLSSMPSLKVDSNVRIVCLYDHEEIGSQSAQGANSTFTATLFRRLVSSLYTDDALPDTLDKHCLFEQTMAKSFLLSADQAHAVHPSWPERYETAHKPAFHSGLVLKYNCSQRYATNGLTATIVREVARKSNVPLQEFVIRQDQQCGSTIGPILATQLGVATADVGGAQLAMHSCRETTCTTSISHAISMYTGFFEHLPNIMQTISYL